MEKRKGRANDFYRSCGKVSCCEHVCRWKRFCLYDSANGRENIVVVGNLGYKGNGYDKDGILYAKYT